MVSPEDILQIVDRLEDYQGKEVIGRMIADRAYYSAYHKAMSHSEIKESLSKNGEAVDYQHLITAYKHLGHNKGKVISQILADLRRRRNHADYNINEDFDIYDGKEAVLRAKEIFKLC